MYVLVAVAYFPGGGVLGLNSFWEEKWFGDK
jgi:hypothetical protein